MTTNELEVELNRLGNKVLDLEEKVEVSKDKREDIIDLIIETAKLEVEARKNPPPPNYNNFMHHSNIFTDADAQDFIRGIEEDGLNLSLKGQHEAQALNESARFMKECLQRIEMRWIKIGLPLGKLGK